MPLTRTLAVAVGSVCLIALGTAPAGARSAPYGPLRADLGSRSVASITAAYSLLLQTYGDFAAFLDSDSPFAFRVHAQKLESELERANCDANRRLAFETRLEILGPEEPARTVRWTNRSGREANLLVIAAPSNPAEPTFVLLSSRSPRRTSLLLVERTLRVRLAYDSLSADSTLHSPLGPVGVVESVTRTRDGVQFTDAVPGIRRRTYGFDLGSGVFREIPAR
jgi:hypothetical protein